MTVLETLDIASRVSQNSQELLSTADKIKKWDQENTEVLYIKSGTTGFDVSSTPVFTNEIHVDMQDLLSFIASKKQ